jgi:hypothetical protein
MKILNIMDMEDHPESSKLEQLKLNYNETPVVTFTGEFGEIHLHYCNEPEYNGYVPCNGEGCVLCRIGRKPDERYLLPVYSVLTDAVAVLVISSSRIPQALYPQLTPILKMEKNQLIFITRLDWVRYKVIHRELAPDVFINDAAIKKFVEAEDRYSQIESIFPRFDNSTLKEFHDVNRMLKLKGVNI